MKLLTVLLALPLTALAAPVLEAARGSKVIPNRFIVVMKQDADDSLFANTLKSVAGILGAEPKTTYNIGSFKGFTVSASNSLIQTIAALGAIQFIEPDTMVTTQALVTQNNPPYGLARISSRQPGTTKYTYDSSAGEGVIAYGIDTGIYCAHSDFGGRCIFGKNFAGDNINNDGNGHGTHTAATMVGTKYGVAKKATVIAVKVLDSKGSGASSNVIAGLAWAADDMVRRGKVGKAVANLSLGSLRLGDSSNQAAAAAIKKGLFLAIAAGNSGAPTALFAPASEKSACTVGASDKNDKYASFSNTGMLVDIVAPGVDVTSAWINGTSSTNTISGTSMAAPHVAGLGAYLLALEGPRDPVALCSRIASLSTKGALKSVPLFTTNSLAFNGAAA